jgi:hypothetical protein
MIKARPILGSTPVIEALLDKRKTQTRRLYKPVPSGTCPYGKAGDYLWFRETWKVKAHYPAEGKWQIEFKAGGTIMIRCSKRPKLKQLKNWQPSIFMPKAAARIWVIITELSIEHLLDISQADSEAEGVEVIQKSFKDELIFKDYLDKNSDGYGYPRNSFFSLWQSINGKGSHADNPLVWVIKFKLTKKPKHLC